MWCALAFVNISMNKSKQTFIQVNLNSPSHLLQHVYIYGFISLPLYTCWAVIYNVRKVLVTEFANFSVLRPGARGIISSGACVTTTVDPKPGSRIYDCLSSFLRSPVRYLELTRGDSNMLSIVDAWKEEQFSYNAPL